MSVWDSWECPGSQRPREDTSGYLIGFIFAAFLIGWLVDKVPQAKQLRYNFPVMLLGILVIYAFGVPILVLNTGMGVMSAILLGGGSFLAVDLLKAGLAAGSEKLLVTKQPVA